MPLNLSPNPTLGRTNLHSAARLGPSNLTFPSDFDPRSLGNLAAWFDARYPAGFGGALPADGTALAQWNDLSGNGRHATQATGSQQPLYRSANPNLLTYNQASVETDTTGLAALNANSTIARSTTDAAHGTASLQVTSVAAGATGATTLTGASAVPVSPSTQYTALVSAKAPTITSNWFPVIYWWQANGSASSTPTSAGSASALTTSYAQLSVTATSPSDAAFASVAFQWTAVAASEIVRADQLGLKVGSSTTWLAPVTLPNGRATVQFDGNGDSLSLGNLALPTPLSIYFVLNMDRLRPSGDASALTLSTGVGVQIAANKSNAYLYALSGFANGPASSVLVPQVLDAIWTAGGTGTVVGTNGILGTPASVGTATWTGSSAIQISAPVTMPGGIASVLVFSAAHTTAQRQQVERWLGNIWGVSVA